MGESRTLEEFNGIHDGSICFIIAAGTSIHFQDLEPLRQHITIAVNSGYVAAPWATYFVSDDWSVARWSYFFNDLKNSDKTIALLYEDKLKNQHAWFGDRGVLFRHCGVVQIPNKYEHDNPKRHIGQTRTSVGSAIMIAHIMGCSEIVLLGVDCCRNGGLRYFWQVSPQQYKMPFRNDNVPRDKYRQCKTVGGRKSDYDLVDISRTWDRFGKAVNKKCKVYNTSDISIVSVFPKVSLERFLEERI